jgi:hypothetical protein
LEIVGKSWNPGDFITKRQRTPAELDWKLEYGKIVVV